MKKLYSFINDKIFFIVLAVILFLVFLHIYYFPNIHIGSIALVLSFFALYKRDNKIKALKGKQNELIQIINNVFDNCPDYIFIKDLDSRYVSANKALLEFLGFSLVENGMYKTDYDFFSPEVARLKIEQDKKVIKNFETFVYDSVYKTVDEEVFFEVTKAPLINEKNEAFGIIGIIRDVTLQKHYKDNLAKEYCNLHAIMDNVPFIAYLRDLEGNLLYKNKSSDILLKKEEGLTAEELFLNFYNENKQEISEIDKEVFKTKQPYIQKKNIVIDEKDSFFEIHKIPILKNDMVDKILIIAKDITLDEEIDLQKETFVATLSHDLKTPTIAQIKALEYILSNEEASINQDDKELLGEVYNSCRYMLKMLNNLILTYKYNDGKIKLNYEKFDIIELLNECCREIRYLYEARNQVIQFKFKIIECFVVADRLEIKRVIVNLLSNAISYSCQNSVIKVSIEEHNDKVSFSIANNVNTIKEEDLDKFFDKFASSADKYKETSSGLGLYLSKQIIESHEGSIFVKKQNDEYVFVFELFKDKMELNKRQMQDELV